MPQAKDSLFFLFLPPSIYSVFFCSSFCPGACTQMIFLGVKRTSSFPSQINCISSRKPHYEKKKKKLDGGKLIPMFKAFIKMHKNH